MSVSWRQSHETKPGRWRLQRGEELAGTTHGQFATTIAEIIGVSHEESPLVESFGMCLRLPSRMPGLDLLLEITR